MLGQPKNAGGVAEEMPSESEAQFRELIKTARLEELPGIIQTIALEDSEFCAGEMDLVQTLDLIGRIAASKDPVAITMPGNEIGKDIGKVDEKYGLRKKLMDSVLKLIEERPFKDNQGERGPSSGGDYEDRDEIRSDAARTSFR